MGLGGTEQHAIRHDDGRATAILQQAQEEVQEEDLGLLALGRQRRVDVRRVDRALEGRVGEHDVVGSLFVEGLGKRIGVAEVRAAMPCSMRFMLPMRSMVMPESVSKPVRAWSGELRILLGELAAGQAVRVALLVVGQVARVGVGFEKVLPGVDEEAAGAGGGIADALAGRGSTIFTIMRMMWRGVRNWPFCAGGVELAEQVFVEVALHVLVLRRNLHGVDGFAGLDEQAGLVDLELGVFHLRREGTARAAESLDEWKDDCP